MQLHQKVEDSRCQGVKDSSKDKCILFFTWTLETSDPFIVQETENSIENSTVNYFCKGLIITIITSCHCDESSTKQSMKKCHPVRSRDATRPWKSMQSEVRAQPFLNRRLITDDWQLMADDWRLITDDWWLTTDGWRLITDNWWLTTDGWRLITDNWWLTTDDW